MVGILGSLQLLGQLAPLGGQADTDAHPNISALGQAHQKDGAIVRRLMGDSGIRQQSDKAAHIVIEHGISPFAFAYNYPKAPCF
jgi:hypothetical protein